ncbi:MAG: helix-turn-helix domain-containing protein [Myxococcota bacterium]
MRGEEPGPEHVEADTNSSIGHYLMSQRKLRGISLDELAARTRIPRRNLERLESGAFDHQPDGFVRGFVRTVAEDLGLDPQEAVMRLLGEPSAVDEDQRRRRRLQAAVAAFVVGGVLLAAAGWAVRETARWLTATPDPNSEDRVLRRDPVRVLAEEAETDPRWQRVIEAANAETAALEGPDAATEAVAPADAPAGPVGADLVDAERDAAPPAAPADAGAP